MDGTSLRFVAQLLDGEAITELCRAAAQEGMGLAGIHAWMKSPARPAWPTISTMARAPGPPNNRQ